MKTNIRPDSENDGWNFKPFFICYPIAIFLALTFFTDYRDPVWRTVDVAFFRLLNDTLAENNVWTTFIAWCNSGPFDAALGAIMAFLSFWVFFHPGFGDFKERFARITAVVFAVLIPVVLAKQIFRNFERLSPARDLDVFFNLNELVPEISAKVGSSSSFPGNHGVASVMLVLCFFIFFRRYPGLVAVTIPIAIVNAFPRLIGGGHWLSDIIVGAGSFALLTYPLLVGTPYLRYMRRFTSAMTDHILTPVLEKVGLVRFMR
ncbi:MAG: phosphatase PAP2 family protein [Sneathiellales bacterium]|nr:phosphatase PAP2 family protein [Sneathiellales bacterium]